MKNSTRKPSKREKKTKEKQKASKNSKERKSEDFWKNSTTSAISNSTATQ